MGTKRSVVANALQQRIKSIQVSLHSFIKLIDSQATTLDEIPADIVNVTRGCPFHPKVGNQHTAPSKYCHLHMHLENETTIWKGKRLALQHVENPLILNIAGNANLPSPTDPINFSDTGCKKPSAVNKFYSSTAGTMMVIRPCGIILNFTEMYECESCSQVFDLCF